MSAQQRGYTPPRSYSREERNLQDRRPRSRDREWSSGRDWENERHYRHDAWTYANDDWEYERRRRSSPERRNSSYALHEDSVSGKYFDHSPDFDPRSAPYHHRHGRAWEPPPLHRGQANAQKYYSNSPRDGIDRQARSRQHSESSAVQGDHPLNEAREREQSNHESVRRGELPSKRELDNTINQKNPGNGVEKNALSAKVTIDRVEPGTNPQIAYTSPESSNTGIKSDTPTNPEVEQVTSLSRPLVSVKEDNVSNGLLHDKHSFAAEHDIEQELQSIDVQIAHYDDVLRLADKEKPPDPLSIEQDALEKEVHEDIANTPEFSQDYGSTSAIKAEDVEVIKQEQPGAVNNSTEGLSTYPISRGNDKGSDGVVQQRDLEISKMEISDIYQNNHRLAARYGRLRCRLPKGFTIENHDGINSLSSNNLISVIHEEHVKSFRMFKPTLVNFLAKHALDLAVKEDDLRKEYKGFWDAWNERNRALDKKKEKERKANAKLSAGTKRKAEDGEVDGYFDPLFDDWSAEPGAPLATPGYLGSSRSSGRRGLYQSDAVRSEAELMEIIRSLETQEMRNPEMRAAKTTANIPSMIMDPYERFRFRFHSTNNYIEDPYNYYHCGEEPDVWSEEERAVFIRKYLAYPKQFGKIASFLPRKTATQCVLHYYRIKKELDVKGLLNSRGGKRKAKGLPGRKKEKVQPLTASGTSQKSKGSSLLSDIGQAQKSFKQGSPDEGEKKPRELRDLEAANASWKAVNERRQRKPTGTMERPYSEYEEAFPSKDAIGIRLDSTSEKKRKIATKPKGRLKGDADLGSPMSMSDATSLTLDTTTQNAEKGTASTTRWTVHDRRRAVAAFQKFGPDFEAVAEAMGTKTELQCKKFYISYTKKHGPESLSARATPDTAADQQESSVHRIDLTKLITNPGNLETPTPSDYALSSEALRAGNVSPRDHPDFGAEEEDAAAALVGMFQMAGPSTVNDQRQQLTNNAIKSNLLRKRHGDNATPELRSPLVPLQTSSLSAAHPSTVNTYWSQAEQDACAGMLREYGPDFRRISYLLQSKTAEQIRAFYEANTQYFRSHDAGSFAPKPDSFVTGRPVGSHQHPAPLDSRYPYAHTPSALDSRRDVEGTYYAEQPNQSMSLPKHASSHGGGDGASQERPSIPRGSSILDLLNEPSPTQDHGHSRRDSAQNADNKSTSTSHIQQHYPPPQPSSPYEYDRSHPAQSGSSPAPHYRTSQGLDTYRLSDVSSSRQYNRPWETYGSTSTSPSIRSYSHTAMYNNALGQSVSGMRNEKTAYSSASRPPTNDGRYQDYQSSYERSDGKSSHTYQGHPVTSDTTRPFQPYPLPPPNSYYHYRDSSQG